MQNLSGQKLGNYELRERLGRGGMAEVYKAYQSSMDRFVAVKVMLGHLATDGSFIERFKREAQAVGKLRHPHIIDIFDFGIEDDIYYMAMEYLTDGNLKEYIDANQQIPLKDSLKIARDLADALAYAHNAGMIHRDLKPANIMFIEKAKMNVVLTDFGIARILNATGLTGTGMAVGTPAYMSPEAGGGSDTDERADIYALGIILYEMLVGRVPYNADTPLAVIMKHINAPLPTRTDYGDNIPEPVERIMLKCLAKDPDDRYANAGDLRDALDSVLAQADNLAPTDTISVPQASTKVSIDNKTVIAPPDAPTTALNRATIATPPESDSSSGRNPLMMIAVIAIIAIVIIGGGIVFFNNLSTTPDEETPLAIVDNATDAPVEETDIPTDEPTTEPADAPTIEPTNEPLPTIAPTAVPEPLEPIAPPQEWNTDLLSWDIDPNDPRNLEYVTEQMLFDGELKDAIERVEELIFQDNPDYIALAARTRIALATGDFPAALEYAEMMYEMDHNNPNGHINLLDALYMLPGGDPQYEWAQEILTEGQALTPDDFAFTWRSIIFAPTNAEKNALYNRAEEQGSRGWRWVLFAGNFLFEQGEYQRAIPYLESAMALPPDIFYLRGRVESQLNYARFQLEYQAIYPDYPLSAGGEMPPHPQNLDLLTNINPILNQAELMSLAGDHEGAIEMLSAILENDPDNTGALFARSQIYSQHWDPDNLSGADANHLIELQPDSAWGYLALSDSFFNYPLADEDSSSDEGHAALERAFELDPQNPHVLYRLARSGDWELEVERMFSAEAEAVSGYRYIFNMGEFLSAKGIYNRAIPYWEVLARYATDGTYFKDEAFWRLVSALIQTDNADSAYEWLTDSTVLDDTIESVTFIDAAYVAYSAGEYDQAEEWANTALAFDSEAYAANWILGNIAYYRDGNLDLAFEYLEHRAFNMGANENNTRFLNFAYGNDLRLERGRILVDRGIRHEEPGNIENGIDYLDFIIEDYSYTPWLYEERANAYLALGNIDAAREDLETAFSISEDPAYRAMVRDRLVEIGNQADN